MKAGRYKPSQSTSFVRISSDSSACPIQRSVAVEMPIGLEINGLGYAVLFATPTDLEDLALGFALSERLADRADDVLDIDIFEREEDVLVRLTLAEAKAERVSLRVRHRATDSACGLCGLENLEQAMRPLPRITAKTSADDPAIFRALGEIEEMQRINRETGAVHAAAFCSSDGVVFLIREDVGRHNAFDKLIGAMAAMRISWSAGFALLTSRCSNELVEKAVIAGCPMLVTVSAPTSLALARAKTAGLRLKTLARRDSLLDLVTAR